MALGSPENVLVKKIRVEILPPHLIRAMLTISRLRLRSRYEDKGRDWWRLTRDQASPAGALPSPRRPTHRPY
jgi:hypothetical protein